MQANSLVVLDFETTGLSPNMGDRAIEIGAVKIKNGEITESFSQLMDPGFRITGFIEDYTGISNHMLKGMPSCAQVMGEFSDFIGDSNLVAHNASFDKRFLDAELALLSKSYSGQFACSMLMARRIYQNAPTHKLGDLIRYKNIPSDGGFHRALYDSQMTVKLWLTMLEDIKQDYGLKDISFSLVKKLIKTPKKSVHEFLNNQK
ncbi:3'-5' exonuclease [Pseudoalteromonas denitrificans]|uniref:DNA-directed DNA polymerase n=1 Tax=Pseudoalteromonas denitrificans DSM 6059 TaxID=1123010 RepID=A0A1I1PZB7_9GAMM|nr:3'-5' exonuclease [Pseudoalteromonas denitrificans]SFD15234.1 DNA polymerase-3 subunit epsilon [Pseudoalteromonas denitrificans DSM 6059]